VDVRRNSYKMSGPRRAPEEEVDDEGPLPLTGMLDMVFILVIFLMIAVNFQTAVLPVDLPELEAPEAAGRSDLELAIDAEGALFLGGRPMELSELRRRARAGDFQGKRAVLRADAAAPTGVFVQALEVLQTAGVRDLQIGARIGAGPAGR